MKRRILPSQRISIWPQTRASTERVCSQASFCHVSFCMKLDVCEHNGGGRCWGRCDLTYRVPWIEREIRLQQLRVNDWTWSWFNFNWYIQYMPQVSFEKQLKRQKRMGEHTIEFAMEINGAVARASEENCEKNLVASTHQVPRNCRFMR